VAGCATPTGSAGHAGATANLKLTFHLDHSAGADQLADSNRAMILTWSLLDAIASLFCFATPKMPNAIESPQGPLGSCHRHYSPAPTR
jgi:hypothetical protein